MPAIDTKVQELYHNTFFNYLPQYIIMGKEFIREYAAANAIPSQPSEIVGGPGTGKTQLILATGTALCGEGNTVVINSYEGIRPEDVIYDVNIELHKLEGGDKTRYVFDTIKRKVMNARFALFNELNRAGVAFQNSLLPLFSEGAIEVKGKRLEKILGKNWIDYNPYFGSFDRAFEDRIISSVVMEELDILEQFQLASKKYGGDRHINSLANEVSQQMTVEQLLTVWDDVQAVNFPEKFMGQALLTLNIFRACKYKLGAVNQAFKDKLDCDECEYNRHCLVKNLHAPVLTRGLDSFIQMSKAFAYCDGRDEVVPAKDLLPSLKTAIVHRLDLKADQLEKIPHEFAWFDEVVVPMLQSRLSTWKKAKSVFESVMNSIKANDFKTAISTYQEYISKTKDITAVSMLKDFTGKKINKMSEAKYTEAMAKIALLSDGKLQYTKYDLNTIMEEYKWLPEKMVENINKGVEYIKYRLDGRVSLPEKDYKIMLRKIAVLRPNIMPDLIIKSNCSVSYDKDGLTISATSYAKTIEVVYSTRDSKFGNIFGEFSQV